MDADAQEMLAALKAVEEWWLREGMGCHTGAPYAIFATRAAIAKAEGRNVERGSCGQGKRND